MPRSSAKKVADILRTDLCAFIHRSFIELNPATTLLHNWHHEVLAQKLEEVLYGSCRRLIINLPPRYLKSHSASIAFPAWALGHNPSLQVLCVSYAQDFSDNLARASRKLMASPFYEGLFDTRISRNRDTVSDFHTTKGGFRFSTSVNGVLTGIGADLIIIDDALKADEALSDTRRNSVNQWYDNTLRSRLNNQETGSIVIIMQRLHADDLVAHVQETEDWEVLSFPAIAEQKETYKISTHYGRAIFSRAPDEILHPTFQSRAVLEGLRRSMTEYNFAAQYQQNPQPAQGLIVKRDWLKFYSPEEKPSAFDMILDSWDTAVKDTELSNFSVCTSWGIKGGKAYLLDVFRKKLEFPDLKKAVRGLAAAHKATVVLVEDKASGSSLIQELRAEGFSLVQAAPSLEGDKIMRLRGQTAKIEGGFVLFPKQAAWLVAYLSELLSFPNAKYDDQVDSTVFALAWVGANPRWASTLIKRPWLRYYTALPQGRNYECHFMSWDTPLLDGAQNDWSVCTAWLQINETYYLLDMVRGIYGYSELKRKFIELAKKAKLSEILIEETPIGKALEKDPDIGWRFSITLLPIEQNRKTRVYTQQAMFESGLVQFPKDAPFMREVENELLSYPHGETDDIVDSISQALTIANTDYDPNLNWL
jgi:predicted phage terminase large subunit-like protein